MIIRTINYTHMDSWTAHTAILPRLTTRRQGRLWLRSPTKTPHWQSKQTISEPSASTMTNGWWFTMKTTNDGQWLSMINNSVCGWCKLLLTIITNQLMFNNWLMVTTWPNLVGYVARMQVWNRWDANKVQSAASCSLKTKVDWTQFAWFCWAKENTNIATLAYIRAHKDFGSYRPEQNERKSANHLKHMR